MMTRTRLLMAMATCALLAGCSGEATPPKPVRPVLSIDVRAQPTNATTVAGTVEPRYQVDLSFRVLGRLIARPVHVGDRVGEGQVVAAVDPAALDMSVRAAAAAAGSSRAQLANAIGVENRQRALLQTNTTTYATLENAEQARAAAHAAVVQAEANLVKAREQLDYARLKTDFGGVVTAVSAEVGQVVAPGQSVVTVARSDVREAVIDIGDDVAARLQPGTLFTIKLQIDPSVTASGRVREIAPQADATTRTRRVRIMLDDPPERFLLGATVTTTMDADARADICLPASAILERNGKTYVWLVDAASKTVKLREIAAVKNQDGSMRIIRGVEAGQRVVTAGVHSLEDGQPVRIEQEARP
jgi:membrane fusion protein, multidrug efflux system